MTWNSVRVMACLAAVLAAGQALAQQESSDLVEKVAVRNRLYSTGGKFEIGANFGVSILSRLTDHYNFNASAAYNLTDWLGLEVRAGYALSRHTSLADQIQADFLGQVYGGTSTSFVTIADLSETWQMTVNSVVGLRFQPIYGKIGLMAELPVHFQLYIWAGGGFGLFQKESLTICFDVSACREQVQGGRRGGYLTETKPGPLVSLALGFRFWLPFTGVRHIFRIEARDFSYLDSYFIEVNRTQLNANNQTGGGRLSPAAGVSNLVMLDLGYTFLF